MIPHTLVLEPGLVIYKIYNGYSFIGCPTLEELLQDLHAVTKKCRPDWDITTPELKVGWQQGRKDLVYPYGRTMFKRSVNRLRSRRRLGGSCGRSPDSRRAARSLCFLQPIQFAERGIWRRRHRGSVDVADERNVWLRDRESITKLGD